MQVILLFGQHGSKRRRMYTANIETHHHHVFSPNIILRMLYTPFTAQDILILPWSHSNT